MGEILIAVIMMFFRRVDWLMVLTLAAAAYSALLIYAIPEYIEAFQQDDRPWPAALWSQISEIASNTVALLALLAFWVLIGLVGVAALIGLTMAPITTLLVLILMTLLSTLLW